jgi:hypothetical protein
LWVVLLLLDEVELMLLVEVEVVVQLEGAPSCVKFPWRPIATSWKGELPVLLTWTVMVVMFPVEERETKVAETFPAALLSSELSCWVSCCLEPTFSSFVDIWALPLTIATAEGIIWYPDGVFTITGLSWRSAAVVPPTSEGCASATWKVLPPVARVTAELVPLTSTDMLDTVKLIE